LEVKPDYENAYVNLGLAYKGLKNWRRRFNLFRKNESNPIMVMLNAELGGFTKNGRGS